MTEPILVVPGGALAPREAWERRLHEMWSLGIGDHIDRRDAQEPAPSPAFQTTPSSCFQGSMLDS